MKTEENWIMSVLMHSWDIINLVAMFMFTVNY